MSQDKALKSVDMSRRTFVVRAAAGVGTVAVAGVVSTVWSRSAGAAMTPVDHAAMHGMMRASVADASALTQTQQAPAGAAGVLNMEGDFYKPVRLPPKPNATPQLDRKQIETFERTIACPCPCTLDIFTCRTTDFSCGFSPQVHADVLAMVKGGYNADEIMAAMEGVYGNFILMAPPKKGVNLIAWFAPFAALGAGAILVNAMLRSWRKNSQVAADRALATMIKPVDVAATDAEMARLQAALRDDNR